MLAGAKSFQLDSKTVANKQQAAMTASTLSNVSSHRVARTADGKKAVLCATSGNASLVDLSTGKEVLKFKIADFGESDSLALSPDASLAFVGTPRGYLKVVSLDNGKPIGKLDIGELIKLPGVAITALAIDASGTNIAVGTSNGKVVVVDANELSVIGQPFSGKGSVIGLKFEGSTKKLNVVTSQKQLATCSDDFNSSKMLTATPSDRPDRLSFSADGTIAAICFAESDRFCIIDFASDKLLAKYPMD